MKCLVLLTVSAIFSNIAGAYGQTTRDFKTEATLLRDALLAYHVAPRTIDDRFSEDVYNYMLEELDPEKIFFTQEDIQSFAAYHTLIDNELNGNNWVFLKLITDRYQSSLKRAGINVQQILGAPIQWKSGQTFDPEPKTWEADAQYLKVRQSLWLKQQILEKVAWLADRDSVSAEGALQKYEREAIQRVEKAQARNISRILHHSTGFENYVGAVFLRSMTAVFDPHSVYLSAADLRNFMGELSAEDYYFGFSIDENDDGEVEITALTPGSPAWRCGELHVSDVLISLQWQGHETIDLTGITLEDVNQVLTDIQEQVVEFTVKKADGQEKKVRIKKEKMEAEENFVRSFILLGEHSVGYIHLPDFYTRWSNDETEGARCANDVAREIVKLKKDGIEGLVLDLRFNGGGSLYEAMAMAGIFIDEGPLGIIKGKEQHPITLKDINRGTIYDGPLALMVNGYSASASEFLAAAIQDYNRGIVVGSQTYGKATGQNILPLDPESDPARLRQALARGEGFIKVTTEKIYRVNGKSAQGIGIKPDIELPDILTALNLREEHMPFFITPDSVAKKTYYKPLPPLNTKVLKQKSQARLAQDSTFVRLTRSIKRLSVQLNQHAPVPLTWKDFWSTHQQVQQQAGVSPETWAKATTPYDVKNNTSENQRLSADGYARDFSAQWSANLKNDIYVHEAYRIMSDYIALTEKP